MKFNVFSVLFVLSIQAVMSQTGPGGVGNATSNGLWLRADNLSLTNSDPVSTWGDFSGNSNDANSAGNGRPLYIATSAMNGMPAVRFDGTLDTMTVSDANILDNSSGLTYFAVIRPNNLDNSPRPILGKRLAYGSSDYAYTWFFYNSNYLNLDINTGNNRFNTNPTSFSNTTNYLLNFVYDGSLAAASRSKISSAGTLITTSTESSTSILNSSANLTLGVLNSGDNREFGADYAELIHYNFALNNAQYIIVHNYLSAKYDIPLTSNDLFDEDDNGNFDFDVAGIGQASDGSNHTDAQGSGIVRMLSANDLDDSEFLIWGHDNEALSSFGITDLPATIQARIARDWSVSETGDVGTVTVRVDLSDVAGAITTSDLRLLIDGDGVYNAGATIYGPPTSLGSNIYEWSGIDLDNNDHFTIGSINSLQTPLPIELVDFKAKLTDNQNVKLEWQTASEINNDYFTIEHSRSERDWQKVNIIKGAGNSVTLLSYSYLDQNPYSGISYYRLKQTDFDGKFHYSQVRSVNINSKGDPKIGVFPNPTKSQITIIGNTYQLDQVIIYNTFGQDVTSLTNKIIHDKSKLIIDLTNLGDGIYYIKTKTTANKVYKQ